MLIPVKATDMNFDEWKVFLDSFDHVFSDCDGVLWNPKVLPGVGDFLKLMKKNGKTVNFVSNNSLRSRKNFKDQFKAAGIENGFENLVTPSIAVAEYLKSIGFTKKVYCVTSQETIKVIESYGFKCEHGPNNCLEVERYEEYYLKFLEDDKDIGAVVFDSDFTVNLAKMYRARTYLSRPEVLFLAGASDKCIVYRPGRIDMAPAVLLPLLEDQVQRKVVILGKPAKLFGELAMKRAGVTDPTRVLLIGDMIEQDLGLGKATGFKTMLILTNISAEQMMAHPVKPDYYAPSLGSLVSKF